MNYRFCTSTDPGLVRGNNEDAVAIDAENGLAILADGMGGYNAGEVASGMAVKLIGKEMGDWLMQTGPSASPRETRAALELCVDRVNQAILSASLSNSSYAGMGTTLVVGVFQSGGLLLGHIGDSRCYRMRHGELMQLTKDHSLLQEQIDAGFMTPQEAEISPGRNLLTRALGVEEDVALEVKEHLVVPGDLYLMCSDGLTDMVSVAEIGRIINMPVPLAQKAQWLVAAANGHGGRDNITVLLVQVEPMAGGRGLISRMLGK